MAVTGGAEGRGALFDLDGTLVNSEPRSMEVWARLLKAHNRPYDEEVLRRFMGRRGPDVVAEDPSLFPGVSWDVLLVELQRIGSAPDLPPVQVLPESVAFVRSLHERGVPVALVTSAGREWAETALKTAGLWELFTGAVTAADVAVGKPDPEGYRAGARMLGVPPEHITVLEDTPAGVEAGRRAGMGVVAVTTTHGRETLSGADLVVDHLTEVGWPPPGGTGRAKA